MTHSAAKNSTARVRAHRQRVKAGLVRVVIELDEDQAEALARARIIQEWATPAENSAAVAALIRQKLSDLLKP
ncbi:hypothetical protein [Bradyrhizobium sp. JYMT SZCCT0428]|uniref:hypothetical protein n=1 Tax=Bradyrhizobium sp. JYMT SZCCT0428 TaxID=2807673 RepID=UPI001BAA7D48|nr:hypothetical protein [Bradyrhizobium sp. JYMT SZCCT0428]MBR1151929.1 hypothetical protein [Bradyrhizobium sp. JYMT SZCCT0428]